MSSASARKSSRTANARVRRSSGACFGGIVILCLPSIPDAHDSVSPRGRFVTEPNYSGESVNFAYIFHYTRHATCVNHEPSCEDDALAHDNFDSQKSGPVPVQSTEGEMRAIASELVELVGRMEAQVRHIGRIEPVDAYRLRELRLRVERLFDRETG